MSLLASEIKAGIKRAARSVGLLAWVNQLEYDYGNRVDAETLAFYGALISPDALCFDIGAHYGRKTEVFLSLGATVVCVEPIRDCVDRLQEKFANTPRASVIPAGCGAEASIRTLHISKLNPQNSTLARPSGNVMRREDWAEQQIDITTLDALVAQHGRPDFCKIDAEGFELEILNGLSAPIGTISFEFDAPSSSLLPKSIQRLSELGYNHFNFTLGGTLQFACREWLDSQSVMDRIRKLDSDSCGDVYCKVCE